MKICLVAEEFSFPNHGGGIGVYTKNLATTFRDLGHTVHIVTSADSGCDASVLEDNIHIHYVSNAKILPITGRRFWGPLIQNTLNKLERSVRVWRVVEKIHKAEGLDIVEMPLWGAEGFFYALKRKSHLFPVVIRLETPLARVLEVQGYKKTLDFRLACWMEAMAAKRADKVIAISDAIKQEVCQSYKLDTTNIVVRPLGIPLIDTANLSKTARADRPLRVMYLGRLEVRKGTVTLLSAIPLVLKQYPEAEFIIIGKDTPSAPCGLTYQAYAHQTMSPDILRRVVFAGPLPNADVERHFASASIFVAPSVYESFGIVYLEAMNWGKPVVACLTGGVPEVVANGETGLLVPPSDAKALAEAIVQLLMNEDLRRRMSISARQRVEKYFSDVVMARSTLEIYQELISANQPSSMSKPVTLE